MKTVEQLQTQPGTFSIGKAISDGWAYVSPNLLYYILGGILTFVISMACGFIPIVGAIVNGLIISPCLAAGAILVTWNISKGRKWTDFGDMFKGFNLLTPLLVSTLIQGLLLIIVAGLILVSYIPEIIQLVKLSSGGGAFTNRDEIKDIALTFLSAKTILLVMFASLFAIFISIIWAFKNHFIVIYNMQGWPAMEASRKIAMKNFVELLGFFIVMGLIVIVSAIPCGLGLFFTLPWMIASLYSAFAQITDCNEPDDINKEGFDFLKEAQGDSL